MRLQRLFAAVCLLLLVSALANAQVPGCPFSSKDRTVEFCTPPEGTSITDGFFLNWYVNDALPYTLCLYVDGVKQDCNYQSVVLGTSNFGFAVPGWHRFTFVAFDSAGTFKASTYFKITSEAQCAKPVTDRQIDICSPFNGAQVLSPVHISAVANSTSVPAKYTVAYIDGNEVGRSYAETNLPANTISTFIPLGAGQSYTLKIKVVDQNNHTFSKSLTFSVVPMDVK